MKTSTRCLTRSALAAALAVAFLYLTALLPTARLAVICLASVCVILVRMNCGPRWAAGCYASSAILAMLLLPEKGPALLYAAFLGYYPLIKLETERFRRLPVRWAVRLALFNLIFWLLYFLAGGLIGELLPGLPADWMILLAAANAGFVLYDYALTQVILIYIRKIDGRI